MLQRGLTNMDFDRAATALAFARQAPTMWANRDAPMVLLNSVGSLPAIRFMPERANGKVVLYVHELDDSFERTLGSRAWDLLSPRVDHFITCGERVTEMLAERKGVPRERITEHPGFVDESPVEPLRSLHLRRQMGIGRDAIVVGASGKPEWRKGPELFVRVARTLADRRPDLDVHFVWLGGPVDDSPGWKLIHDIEAAGLAGRVHLTGETRRPAEIMNMFDLYALTSREDPYPLSMIEAAGLGVPVVSFDNGGVGGVRRQRRSRTRSPRSCRTSTWPAWPATIARLIDDPVARRPSASEGGRTCSSTRSPTGPRPGSWRPCVARASAPPRGRPCAPARRRRCLRPGRIRRPADGPRRRPRRGRRGRRARPADRHDDQARRPPGTRHPAPRAVGASCSTTSAG